MRPKPGKLRCGRREAAPVQSDDQEPMSVRGKQPCQLLPNAR